MNFDCIKFEPHNSRLIEIIVSVATILQTILHLSVQQNPILFIVKCFRLSTRFLKMASFPFAGLKKQFNKANQFMTERITGVEGTKLDNDFQVEFVKLLKKENNMKKFIPIPFKVQDLM